MGSAHAEILEALSSTSRTSNEADLKIALGHLQIEVRQRLARSSDSGDFITLALSALSKIRGSVHAEIRMNCLWDCSQYLYFNGQSDKALPPAQSLRSLAALVGHKAWLRKATMLIGILHADAGNIAEALPLYSTALEQARVQRDVEGQVSVLANTGIALNYGALYREAIPCFRKAKKLALEAGLESYIPRICINLAQSHYHLDEMKEGFAAAKESLETSSAPTDVVSAMSAIVREYTYVELALELGKLKSAREHAKICGEHAQWCGSPRGKALSDVAIGLCEVHGGNVDRGLQLLEQALCSARELDAIRSVVLTALVKAYDAAHRPEQALAYLEHLLEHKRQTRKRSLASLFELPSDLTEQTYVSGEIDLRAFEFKEAQLIARVAEREVILSRIEMFERLAITADLKEEASGEHGYRVGKLAALTAEELDWTVEASQAIELAARLHDIGKLGLPDRILLSSLELKEAERHFISAHVVIGAELLSKSNIPQLRMAEDIARYHHEWWNGEGYPSKLAGKRIPIHARIVALADVFDALTHGRPFSKPWPIDRAIEEIRKRRGTQFDPELTDLFLELIERLRIEHTDLDEYLGRAGRNSPFLQARNKIRLMLAEERENEKMTTVEGNQTRH